MFIAGKLENTEKHKEKKIKCNQFRSISTH